MRIRFALTLLVSSALGCAGLSSCSHWFFSGAIPGMDLTRPVARVNLVGHPSQLAATTTEGILFLNADKAEGACRVHYFLGPDVHVDAGVVQPFGDTYSRAIIDLRTQAVPVMTREPNSDDQLVALVLQGDEVEYVDVELANTEAAEGYALRWPYRDLPLGTGIFRYQTGKHAGDLEFVGLANGLATLKSGDTTTRFITFTGPARMREVLALPQPVFRPQRIKHRPDGITIRK